MYMHMGLDLRDFSYVSVHWALVWIYLQLCISLFGLGHMYILLSLLLLLKLEMHVITDL